MRRYAGELNSSQIIGNIENKNKTTEKSKERQGGKKRENIIDTNHFRIFKIKDIEK